jgi:acyl carrier protein phosphodiesterase
MNYLAHLFLSEGTPHFLVGNLLGDFVKGKLDGLYPDEIQRGIRFHRHVDRYTDTHPIFRASKRRISLERGRFSGILIDIFYDHFLAKNWSRYSATPLVSFSQSVYQILQDHYQILPRSLQRFLPHMIVNDLLASYREIGSIDRVLHRMAFRLKRQNNLADGVEDLTSNYQQLESDFFVFFPELIHYTRSMYQLQIKTVSYAEEINEIQAIRRQVFQEEQGVSPELELDGKDDSAIHFMAYLNGRPVGTTRIRSLEDVDDRRHAAKIERLAVLKTARGQGIGRQLMQAALQWIQKHQYTEAIVNAQLYISGLYESLGFKVVGEVFEEAGIQHIQMIYRW